MNQPLLNGSSCQSRHIKYCFSSLKIFRLRNSSAFLTLLAVFILTSLCFLLLTDLHTRYSIANFSSDPSPTDQTSDLNDIAVDELPTKRTPLQDLSKFAYTLASRSISSSSFNSTFNYKLIIAKRLWSSPLELEKEPWFIRPDGFRPTTSLSNVFSNLPLFPDEDSVSDRIINQLMYIPPNYHAGVKDKIIHLNNAVYSWNRDEIDTKENIFKKSQCPVHSCSLTIDPSQAAHADAIIFKDQFYPPEFKRRYDQLWILYLLESPLHTSHFPFLRNAINWTATYRRDSDIVTPYSKYFRFPSANLSSEMISQSREEKEKTLLRQFRSKSSKSPVAWFVSNCAPSNNRGGYAEELSKYIKVDIYGACGTKVCPRGRPQRCANLLSSGYKFYLSFENSNCKDYITEKFFNNGLQNNIIPIVMGARKEDYAASAPPNSFIHVDDYSTPKQLAQYLNLLAQNETMYMSYFQWKLQDHWYSINTFFWCRLCAMLHSPRATRESHYYTSVGAWWAGKGVCETHYNWMSRQEIDTRLSHDD